MTLDWLDIRGPPIEACEHGVRENAPHFNSVFVGPRTFDRIEYPSAMVLPENTSRTGGNEFTHRVDTVLYFERTRGYDYVDDILHPVAAVISDTLTALRNTECVITYMPAVVEDYAGELDGTSVLMVRVQFEISTVRDVSEAGATD